MPSTCCVYGCRNRFNKSSSVKFYRFPTARLDHRRSKREKWIYTIQRINGPTWRPSKWLRICSEHFITGKPSETFIDQDYVPSVFVHKNENKEQTIQQFERRQCHSKSLITTTVQEDVLDRDIASKKWRLKKNAYPTLCIPDLSTEKYNKKNAVAENRKARCILWRSLHTLPINLAIKRSSLPGVSYGIWSKEYIPVGTRFGPYSDITSEDLGDGEVQRKKDDLSVLESEEETQPNWLGYINCTRNEVQQNLLGFHLQNSQGKVELYYLNYKPILPNTELLIWHSKTYTKTLGIEPRGYTYGETALNPICYSDNSKRKMVRKGRVDDDLQNSVFCLEISNNGIKKPDIVYDDLPENTFMKDSLLDNQERLFFRENPFVNNGIKKPDIVYDDLPENTLMKDSLLDNQERLFCRENPFVCHICYYSFSSIKELQVHMRAHADGSTYECDICHKVFSRIYSLHSHKMTHSANLIKPYACNVCDKRYSKKLYLKKHVKIHLIEEARLQYLS